KAVLLTTKQNRRRAWCPRRFGKTVFKKLTQPLTPPRPSPTQKREHKRDRSQTCSYHTGRVPPSSSALIKCSIEYIQVAACRQIARGILAKVIVTARLVEIVSRGSGCGRREEFANP